MKNSPDWLEKIWGHRDEALYPSLFGPHSQGFFPVPRTVLEQSGIADERLTTCGVFTFAPTPERPTWVYVSSGLSNEWFKEQPVADQPSGFGCEFLLETPEKAEWAVRRLNHLVAYQMGLWLGRFGNLEPLAPGARVALGKPIDFEKSPLDHLLLTTPATFPAEIHQESGTADLIQVFGISEGECEIAKQKGNDVLIDWLKKNTRFPLVETVRGTMAAGT